MTMERFAVDPRISEVASLIMIAQTGVGIPLSDTHQAVERLTLFAEEHDLQPEDVQAAIFHSEPRLRGLDD